VSAQGFARSFLTAALEARPLSPAGLLVFPWIEELSMRGGIITFDRSLERRGGRHEPPLSDPAAATAGLDEAADELASTSELLERAPTLDEARLRQAIEQLERNGPPPEPLLPRA